MDESKYFEMHLNTLYKNCFRGKMHFNVWEDLNKSLKENGDLYKKYNFFWATTLKSQLEAAQLHLIKLFDKPKKSVTVDRLVKYAEQNKEKLFDSGDLNLLEIHIRDYKSDIKEYGDEIDSIMDIRNNHFVHLSREHVNDYDKLYDNYSEIRENIIEILLICGDILSTFKKLAYNDPYSMVLGIEHQTKEIIEDLTKNID